MRAACQRARFAAPAQGWLSRLPKIPLSYSEPRGLIARIMKNRTPVPRADRDPLPAFDPVPRRKPRHDGWTPARQRAFIEALADTGSVSRAAAMVNMSPESAYQLRRQPGAESFRRAWEAALDFGVLRLRDIALERAIEGQLVPVFAGGRLLGYRRKKNDRLLMFALRMNARGPDGRRLSAHYFDRRDGAEPASIAHPVTSAAERDDDNAARIADFAPVPLGPRQQAEVYEALAAEARVRADRLPEDNPEVPFVALGDASGEFIGELEFSPTDSRDFIPLDPDERPWDLLHDEAGAQAIDDAVARVKAAKAAGFFDPPPLLEEEAKDLPRSAAEVEADTPPPPQLIAPASADPEPRLSPKTGKPVRLYRKRTPKPPFVTPLDRRE